MNTFVPRFGKTSFKLVIFSIILMHISQLRAWAFPGFHPGSPRGQGANKGPATEKEDKESEKIEVFVSVNVPVNANASDEFVLSPFPVKPPKCTNGDFQLSTKLDDLKELLKNAILYKWGKESRSPTDWRVDRALELALRRSRKHLPQISTDMEPFLDEFLPYFKDEVLAINEREKIRQKRFHECVALAGARTAYEELAATTGLEPIPLRVCAIKPGIREAKVKQVERGVWWVIGTHSVPGLTYYWQEKHTLEEGTRLYDLNEQNALFIKGHY